MQVEILYRPSCSMARATLDREEKIQIESGSMVGMSPDLVMEKEAKGGLTEYSIRRVTGRWLTTVLTLFHLQRVEYE